MTASRNAGAMDRSQLTPLFVQYYDLKDANPGCLMLMRVGDFFEAYGEDAETLARDTEIVLTAKEAGGGLRLAMSGVPFFAFEPYLRSLVSKGHRVAIAEQMEAATPGKGIVRREVARVVTAGTILDPQMLDEHRHNYLMALVTLGDQVGLAVCDVSTGDFQCTELESESHRIAEEIERFRPSELLLGEDASPASEALGVTLRELGTRWVSRSVQGGAREAQARILRQFELRSLQACDLQDRSAAVLAAGVLLAYLQETTRNGALSLEPPRGYSLAEHMVLDTTTLRNLELVETLMGRERQGSLLWAMDYTLTSMGSRLLRQWMTRPLIEVAAIQARSASIQRMVDDFYALTQLRETLQPIKDIERLLARVVYQTAHARDLLGLQRSLAAVPALAERLPRDEPTWQRLTLELAVDHSLVERLGTALGDEPPMSLREGGIIADGFSPELDQLRLARRSAKEWIASLEERERETSGIRGLKVGYNQVFGYFLEVSRSQQKLVPDRYIRKQTLANAERYFTPELKEIEAQVLGAEDKIRQLEYDLFCKLRDEVSAQAAELRRAARAVAEVDLLAGLAEAAVRHQWTRPEITVDNRLEIEGGRHPVVERGVEGVFVPNDCLLENDRRLVVLTGPNMSGKSTFLRQNAVIVIMAQMGSLVPAQRAVVGICDRVFTRVGASDDLHLGQSTFMVEMSEAANILRHATERSLVILDEIGRGTSTYDGLALARAISEYLYLYSQSKTLFATHFHELTQLAKEYPGITNQRVAVQENRDGIIFLHKIVAGGADRSYGIYVGKLAGLPPWVLDRAQTLLTSLEQGGRRPSQTRTGKSREDQLDLFSLS
jgi:DNA mismatch repair protein MutS